MQKKKRGGEGKKEEEDWKTADARSPTAILPQSGHVLQPCAALSRFPTPASQLARPFYFFFLRRPIYQAGQIRPCNCSRPAVRRIASTREEAREKMCFSVNGRIKYLVKTSEVYVYTLPVKSIASLVETGKSLL